MRSRPASVLYSPKAERSETQPRSRNWLVKGAGLSGYGILQQPDYFLSSTLTGRSKLTQNRLEKRYDVLTDSGEFFGGPAPAAPYNASAPLRHGLEFREVVLRPTSQAPKFGEKDTI